MREYFNEPKLQVWLSNCDILQDAHDRIGEMIYRGFVADMDTLSTGRIIGRFIRVTTRWPSEAVGAQASSS